MQTAKLLLCFLMISTYTFAQTPFCITEELMSKDANYQQHYQNINNLIHKATLDYYANQNQRGAALPAYTLPVVIHLVVPPGTAIGQGNNLTDAQVEAGLSLLNDAFANRNAFKTADGVDMNIQFCLAKRDPNGKPTNGITRTESALVAKTSPCTPFGTDSKDDVAIKSLSNWDCKQYINIWLVTDLFDNNFGCSLAGYAYFPGAGCGVDGIVQESRYWTTVGGTRVTAHEMGHFFSLNHTFSGGCTNADCLLDGDMVCDTPPDNSPSFAACNTNSCATDTPDLPDDNTNYMDYTSCSPPHFTAGQQLRAIKGLEQGRASLISSIGCQTVADYDIALLDVNNGNVGCNTNFKPTLTLKNKGLNTITSCNIKYTLNGGAVQTLSWSGNLGPNITTTYTLPNQILAFGAYTFSVTITDINGTNNDEYPSDNSATSKFEVYPSPTLSLGSIKGSKCISDGSITVKATGGTPPYLFTNSGSSLTQNDGYFDLLIAGNYSLYVTDDNGCRDTIAATVPDSCNITAPNQFVVNGDAVYLGGDCYRLTPEQTAKAGSIWYDKKINLGRNFEAEFDMNLGRLDGNGADGIAFVLQPISTAIGIAGGGLGYQSVSPSLAVEFDTWQNCCSNSTANNSPDANDPVQDHVAIMRDGAINHRSGYNLAGPVDIIPFTNAEDNRFHNIRITWDARIKKITVFVDCRERVSYQGDIVSSIFNNDPNVFFGFTAATGGAFNVQQVCLKYISFLDNIPNQTICEGGQIQLAAPSDFASYKWTPSVGINNANVRNPIFSPTVTTTYYVAMTNKCGVVTRDTVDINVTNLDLDIDTSAINPCSTNPTLRLNAKSKTVGVNYALNNNVFYSSNTFLQDRDFSFNQNYTFYAKLGNCTVSKTVKVPLPKPLRDSVIFEQGEFCTKKGIINIVGLDGIPPYQYKLDTSAYQSNGYFGNLKAGTYIVTVKDQQGCEIKHTFILKDLTNKITLQVDSSKLQKDCFNNTAFVSVIASGRITYYYYSIDKQPFTQNNQFKNLSDGAHHIIARDDYGCLSDTISVLVVNKTGISRDTTKATICQGAKYTFEGKDYNKTGFQIEYYKNQYGCDSILVLDLTVLPILKDTLNVRLCSPKSFTLNNKTYNKTNIYSDTLSTAAGCDSIIFINLIIDKPIIKNQKLTLCAPATYAINNNTYTTTGIYTDTLSTADGCDSVVVTNLTINPQKFTTLSKKLCEGQQFILNNITYNTSGIYNDTLKTTLGCDSVLEINLTYFKKDTTRTTKTLCENKSIVINNRKITKAGTYSFNLKNQYLCDSTYIVEVTTLDTSRYYQQFLLCEGDSILVGSRYYKRLGRFETVLQAANGCDSIYTITIREAKTEDCDQKFCSIYIPNTFSPNGDNNNDTFEVYTTVAQVSQLQIFDRWGDLQYEEKSAQPRWDGTSMRGGYMNSGVYIYVIRGICGNGKPFTKSGDITLIR